MTGPLWACENVTSSQRWSKEEIRSVYGTATIEILAWRTGVTLCMSLRNFPGHFSCHGLTFLIDTYHCCHFPCVWLIVVVTALIPQNHWRCRDVRLVDGPSGAAVVCVGALLWQVLPLFNTLWLTRSEQTFDTWPQGCGGTASDISAAPLRAPRCPPCPGTAENPAVKAFTLALSDFTQQQRV